MLNENDGEGEARHVTNRFLRVAMLLGVATILPGALLLTTRAPFVAPLSRRGFQYRCNPTACDWHLVPSPNGNGSSVLRAVAEVSATDIWAVGIYSNNDFTSQTLTEHWNGSAWSVVKSPNVGTHPRAS